MEIGPKWEQMIRDTWQDGYNHGEAAAMAVRYTMEELADRIEAAELEGYERGRAESQKVVADAAFDHGLRIGRSANKELRWMYEQSVEATLARVTEAVQNVRHEDACCTNGCACQRPEPCDLLCNCMAGSVIGEVLYALSKINPLDAAIPEPPAPNAQPARVNRWSGRDE